jgi:peptidoglycan-associated lipoprotein
MNKKFWWVLTFLALTGCSSVSLDEGRVPVEDRTAAAAATAATAESDARAAPVATTTIDPRAGAQSRVAPVAVDNAATLAAGPAGVARLIYFDYDSVAIKTEFQGLIEGHARFLRANPARRIAVEGHTDERGGREYNLALGQRRAEAVRRALGLLGVPDNQIEAVSLGKEKPAASGADETVWAKNRRAEIAYR